MLAILQLVEIELPGSAEFGLIAGELIVRSIDGDATVIATLLVLFVSFDSATRSK